MDHGRPKPAASGHWAVRQDGRHAHALGTHPALAEARLGEHTHTAWPQLAQPHIRHHGAFAYGEAELADGERVKLMRLRHTGAVGRWGFALYLASHDRYEDSPLPTGSPTGTPADALDCACQLHLAAPGI